MTTFIRRRTLDSGKVRYYVVAVIDGHQRHFGGFNKKKDAEAKLRTVRSRIASDSLHEKPLTLEQFSSEWLEAKKQALKPSSYQSYEQSFRLHILPYLGEKKLQDLKPLDIQAWVGKLTTSGMSAATLSRCYRGLHAALSQAVAWGLMQQIPCRSIELPRVAREEMMFLDPADIHKMLEHSPEPQRTLYATLVYTGLRLGEALALNWAHLDFSRGMIIVEKSWSPDAGYQEPKTPESRRSVPMVPTLAEMLSSNRGASDELVFTHNGVKPMHPSGLRRRLAKVLEAAELPYVTLHSLRHTFASAMLASGCSVKGLQKALGHASAMMTLNIYAHLVRDDYGDSLARLETMLSGVRADVIPLDASRRSGI